RAPPRHRPGDACRARAWGSGTLPCSRGPWPPWRAGGAAPGVQAGRRGFGNCLLVHDAAAHVLIERTVGVEEPGRRAGAVAKCLCDVTQDIVVDAVGDFRPERSLVDVSIDVDDKPVLDLVLHRSRLGEIVACIGTRGNLLELADARRGFTDVHVATCVRSGRPKAAGHGGECIALPFGAQSEFAARMRD